MIASIQMLFDRTAHVAGCYQLVLLAANRDFPSAGLLLAECSEQPCCSQVTADILGTTVGFSHHSSKGVDWVFVEHGSYDRPGGLYGDENGVYGDNQVWFFPTATCKDSLRIVLNDCMRLECNHARPVTIQQLCWQHSRR